MVTLRTTDHCLRAVSVVVFLYCVLFVHPVTTSLDGEAAVTSSPGDEAASTVTSSPDSDAASTVTSSPDSDAASTVSSLDSEATVTSSPDDEAASTVTSSQDDKAASTMTSSSDNGAASEVTSERPVPPEVSEKHEAGGQVHVIKRGKLEQTIKKHSLLLVQFYKGSDPDGSRPLEVEFSLAAEVMHADQPEIRFARMDLAEVEANVMYRYRMTSDRAEVILFREGQAVKYERAMRSYTICAWLRMKTGTMVTNVKDRDTLDRIIKAEVFTACGLFKGGGRSEPLAYMNLAEEMQTEEPRIRFTITDSARMFAYLNISADSAVVVIKKFDEGRSELTEHITKARIRKFLMKELVPRVILYRKATSAFIRHHEIRNRLLLFINRKADDNSFRQTVETLDSASVAFKNKVFFVVFDVDKDDGKEELGQFGSPEDCPLLVFVGPNMRRLPNASLLTKESVEKFVQDALVDAKQEPQVPEKTEREAKVEL